MKKILVVVMILFLSLSLLGCLTLTGAGLGAGTGALVGVAAGKKDIGRAAAWGALAGGTLGALADMTLPVPTRTGYRENYYQPRMTQCWGQVESDVWGTDIYGNSYVMYKRYNQIQVPCPY